MKSTIMFVAASLILVTGIVAVALPNAVEAAHKPVLILYCQKGHEGDPIHCAPTRELCKQIVVAPGESGKCVRVVSK